MKYAFPTKLLWLFLALLSLWSGRSFAEDYYWVNGAGDWNDGSHWSLSSGGPSAGTVPGKTDNAIFDHASLVSDFSLIHITADASINDLTVNSSKFASFHGADVNFTIHGNLDLKSRVGFHLGGKIYFKNDKKEANNLQTGGIDFDTDLAFEKGSWNLLAPLKTSQNHSMYFNSGTLISNGFTVHGKNIIANQSSYDFDFTGSFVSVLELFDVPRGKNIGDEATYSVISDLTDRDQLDRFIRAGDMTRDVVVLCDGGPLEVEVEITSDYNGSHISCHDSCDGEFTITASGTPGPFAYRINPGEPWVASNVFSDLCHGTYTIGVMDSSNELGPDIYEVCNVVDFLNEPGELSFDPPVTINPTCPGTCDGQAFITALGGGTGTKTVFWPNSGETTPFPVMLCVGENPLVITDENGCTRNDTITISAPLPIAANPTITPPTCLGDCDASILLAPTGGNGAPYTYNWVPAPPSGAGSNPGDGFCAGTVDVTILDVDGCTFDTTITIIDPPLLEVTVDGIVDATCNGDCDGQANAVVTGGVPGYTFEWFDDATGLTTGITDQSPTTLCAGDYYVEVTDDAGCVVTSGVITIGEPAPFVFNVDTYDVSCFGLCDGSADIDITGGTPGYTYSWTSFPDGTGIGATDSISGLCAGEYQIIVTDDAGCTTPATVVEVFEPTEIDVPVTVTNPSCYDLCDGSAEVIPSGGTPGYTFEWLPAPGTGGDTATPSDMCPGVYTVTVTDDNGCTNDSTVTLTSPDVYDITSVVTDLDCFGDTDGAIDITVISGGSGFGYTYTWVPTPPVGDGTANVSGLGAGIWTVTISDSESCDTTLNFEITSPPELILTASVIANASCNGDCDGSAEVTIAGGTDPYDILWDDPAAQTTLVANSLCAGTYTVTVTDDNGCIANETVDITEPTPFVITTDQTNPECFGDCDGTATVTVVSGGTPDYTILWDDPLAQTTFTAIGLCAGTYTATVTDNNLCDTILTFVITEPDELIVDIEVLDSSCFGVCDGSAFVTHTGGTGPFTYEWYDAATDIAIGVDNDTITGLCPGDYYAIVTDDNGCTTQSVDITITELEEIVATIVSTTDATCALCDGTAEISVTGGAGGFTYDWDPDPTGGDGAPAVTGLCSGAYNVTITDMSGCEESIVVSIDDIALEVLELDSIDVTCFGDCDGQAIATFVPLDGPYTLEWFDNATGLTTGIFGTPATGLCAGEYLAVLTNASGCVTTEVITVNEPEEITGTITPTDVSCDGFCDGSASVVVTGGVPPYNYDWGVPLPGTGEGTPDAGGLCPGPWEVEVTDDAGCTVTFTTTINAPDALIIDAESSTGISCFGDSDGTASVIVSGGTPTYTYNWFDCATGLPIGQTDPLATGLPPGSYQCEITDDNGCTILSSCIPVDDAPEITAVINPENISCFGECDGLIWVVPGGGAGTYFFQWLDEFGAVIPGQTNDSIENVCAGIYNIEITDLNGCSQVFGPIDLTSPSEPWDVVTSQTDVTCAGDCDGTATVVVLGGNNPPYTYLWDDPLAQTTPTANFLCEGTWSVTISDAGVCDTTLTFEIIDSPVFANMTDIQHNDCFGDCEGQITVAPFGGVPPYTLNWSDGQIGTNAVDLCAGPITLTITDGAGCIMDTTFVITEAPEITVVSSFSNNTTCGLCNGSATVNVTGGTPDYTYDWDPDPTAGEGTNSASGLCPGVVSVLITDANGCTFTQAFGISDVDSEDVTVTSTDASCFGECDGTADAIFTCEDPICTQEWFDAATGLTTGVTTTSITDLCAGEYFVEVINASGCITVEAVIIDSPTEIMPNEVITPINCAGSSDGRIELFPSGGSGAGYTYSWSPVPPNGDGTNEAIDIGPGLWEVTVTDDDGCSQTFSYEIEEPEPIVLTATPTDVACNGDCNGSISVVAEGGAGGFTFQWFEDGAPIAGETSALLAAICAGNYNVEVTDANGCTVTLPEDITINEPPVITAPISSTNVTCFGECDGTATVTVTGGVPGYTINWYDAATAMLIGATGPTATDLCPGEYYAVISDINGCSITSATVEITAPDMLEYTLTSTDATCFDLCDGTADIVASGGTPAYSYEWLTIGGDPIVGGTDPSVIDLCPGNYTVEVTDDNGCTTGTIPVIINSATEITASVFSNDATCAVADGNATVFALGGTEPYTYQWFDAAMTPLAGETSNILMDVFSGIYFVTVTDDNGCSQTFMATINDEDAAEITFDAINHPTCFGECDGSIEVTVTGDNPPFVYTWNPGGLIAEDPTGLCAGDYILEVTDILDCKTYANTTLVDPIEIIATADIIPTDCGLCNGGIDLTVSGGTGALTVLWNTGSTELSISDLCPGVYEVEVTDENGCSVFQSFIVPNSEGLTGDVIINTITCADACDGMVTVNGVGGTPPYTYTWLHNDSPANTQSDLCAGTYYVQIMDSRGCVSTVEAEIPVINPITAIPTMVNPTCSDANGSISVISSGGVLPHSYSWSTGPSTPGIDGLTAGIYILTITDDNGCTEEFTFTLNNSDAAVIELVSTDIDCYGNCNGSLDTLSVTGGTPGYTFSWADESGTALGITTPLINDLCAGDYILEVTDAAGCISYQGGTIAEPDTILLNPLFINNPLCNGDCNGSLVSNPFGGTTPYTFAWDDPDGQTTTEATGLCAGTYEVTITDGNGCVVSQSETLIEPDVLTATVDDIVDATCQNAEDGAISITASGGTPGYSYEWVGATYGDVHDVEDPTNILPQDYYLTVTDTNGCEFLDTVTVGSLITVIADAGADTVICFNTDLLLIGTSNIADGATYTWYDTLGNVLSTNDTLTVPGTEGGNEYYVLEVSFSGCFALDTVIVTTANQVVVDAGEEIELYSTQTGTIGGSPTTEPTNTVEWDPPIYLSDTLIENPSVIEPQVSTWYYVTATDTNGCTNIDSVLVTVLPDFIIPDGISPSEDGKNDTWILDFIDQYPGVSIKINVYNRWGDLLFESDENYNDDWGGTTEDGKRLPAGTYYYVIDVDHEDFPEPFTGPITIMW